MWPRNEAQINEKNIILPGKNNNNNKIFKNSFYELQ